MYKTIDDTTVFRTADSTSIPADPENVDYQAYLAWMEAGGVPETSHVPGDGQ